MAALQKPQAANLAEKEMKMKKTNHPWQLLHQSLRLPFLLLPTSAAYLTAPPPIRAGFKGAPPLLLYVGVLHPIMFGVAWLVCDTPLVLLGVALTRY